MALKVITGTEENLIEILGNTTQTKELVTALINIGSGKSDQSGNNDWEKVKSAFENFGFRTAFDRNMIIITGALFAAISKSGDADLKEVVKKILDFEETGTISPYKKARERLNLAIGIGDGGCIYKILKKDNHFQNILSMIGLEPKCINNYINRMKRITPWRVKKSRAAAIAVSNILIHMRGKQADGKDVPDIEKYTHVSISDSNE